MADALLARPVLQLQHNDSFIGAGIYAIYYIGNFPAYKPIADKNKNNKFTAPIYIGKAVPAGARKGGLGLDAPSGNVLFKRLSEHADSIKSTKNLKISDFYCRHLVVDDIWIPLGESLLIEMFTPPWNKIIDGFGNHDPGSGRYNQQRSPWDQLHPGRPWAEKLKANNKSEKDFLKELDVLLKNH